MRSLLLAVLAAYVVAAIHAVLAFVNKRRSLQRVSEWSMAVGFVLHTGALIADWAIDGHYPLFYLRETLSFLAWTLVAAYGLVLYRYRAQAVGAFTMPLVSVLTFIAIFIRSGPVAATEANGLSATWLFPVLTWLLYLLLIIYRSTANWRGRKGAWMGVVGFALVLCTFFGTRLLGGYHVFG